MGFIELFNEQRQTTSIHSHESMGRALDAVCLFDLRSKPIEIIEKIRGWYNFLAPRFEDKTLAYLLISPDFYDDLTLISDIDEEIKKGAMYLPDIECWYRGHLLLDKIEMIYKVHL